MNRKSKYEWLDEYCLDLPGAAKDYKQEWDAVLYTVGGKIFALCGGDKNGESIITLMLDPANGDLMRQQNKGIVPGYYMNKEHWNSLYLEGGVPDDVVRAMINESHQLVFQSLSKKTRNAIMGI